MTSTPTSRRQTVVLLVLVLIFIALCFAGCAGPPTRIEHALFNITTNWVEVTATRTNWTTARRTNWVTVNAVRTNEVNVVVTNRILVGRVETNVVTVTRTVTNTAPSYSYAPGSGETAVKTGVGLAANAYGAGGVAVGVSGLLFGFWRRRRSGVQNHKP